MSSEQELPGIERFKFGPFEDSHNCTFIYDGIDEACSNEVTHAIIFEGDYPPFYRCDEHGFPSVVRERKRREYGYPPKCEVCPRLRKPKYMADDTEGKVTLTNSNTGEEETWYCCQECADKLGVELEEIDA